jgi:ParE toxin of type II toxin-antitoxin system, parDE
VRVRLIPIARREMLKAARRYKRKRDGLDDRFLDAVREAIIAIRDWPDAHPPTRMAPYRRKILNDFPFSLIYRVDADVAAIVAVAHMKRRPQYWKRRVA